MWAGLGLGMTAEWERRVRAVERERATRTSKREAITCDIRVLAQTME